MIDREGQWVKYSDPLLKPGVWDFFTASVALLHCSPVVMHFSRDWFFRAEGGGNRIDRVGLNMGDRLQQLVISMSTVFVSVLSKQ